MRVVKKAVSGRSERWGPAFRGALVSRDGGLPLAGCWGSVPEHEVTERSGKWDVTGAVARE